MISPKKSNAKCGFIEDNAGNIPSKKTRSKISQEGNAKKPAELEQSSTHRRGFWGVGEGQGFERGSEAFEAGTKQGGQDTGG